MRNPVPSGLKIGPAAAPSLTHPIPRTATQGSPLAKTRQPEAWGNVATLPQGLTARRVLAHHSPVREIGVTGHALRMTYIGR